MILEKDSRTGTYYARVKTAPNRTKRFKTGSNNKQEAKAIAEQAGLKELEQAAKAGQLTNQVIGHILAGSNKLTCAGAVEKFITWSETIGRSASVLNARKLELACFLDLNKLGNQPPFAITTEHCSAWVNQEDGTKFNTRRNKLSILNAFVEYAAANGWIIGNPARLTKIIMSKMSHEQKETEPRRPFTDEEVNRVASYCAEKMNEATAYLTDPKNINNQYNEGGKILTRKRDMYNEHLFWRVAVIMARYVGLRIGDIARLEWETLKDRERITVWTQKTNKRVSLLLHPILRDALALVPNNNTKYVFPEQAELRNDPIKRAKLSSQFGELCKINAIENKSFHDIRARYIQACTESGIPLAQVAKDVGHSSTKTTERYLGERE